MRLKDFHPKIIRGLYNSNHYEAPNGMWIQLHVTDRTFVFSFGADSTLPHIHIRNYAELTEFISHLKEIKP